MLKDSLETFVEGVKSSWGPVDSDLVAGSLHHMEELLKASSSEEWLASLIQDAPGYRELYRDPNQGFLLLGHVQPKNDRRTPHDHGSGWVIYGVYRGEIEMGTYARVESQEGGKAQLVKRETYLLSPGKPKAFLPGDIHETDVATAPAVLFRFTSCDLTKEPKLKRHVLREGLWMDPSFT